MSQSRITVIRDFVSTDAAAKAPAQVVSPALSETRTRSFTRTHDGLVRRGGDPSLMPMHQRPNRVRDRGSRTRFRKYIRRRPPRRRRDGPQDRRARGRVDSLLTCALRHPNAAGPTVVTGKPQPEQQHGGDPRPDQCRGSIIKIAIAFL